MEISAVMNIHELVLNRNVKQKSDAVVKKGPEEASDSSLITKPVDQMVHTVQRADVGEVAQKDTHITGHMVNVVT